MSAKEFELNTDITLNVIEFYDEFEAYDVSEKIK